MTGATKARYQVAALGLCDWCGEPRYYTVESFEDECADLMYEACRTHLPQLRAKLRGLFPGAK